MNMTRYKRCETALLASLRRSTSRSEFIPVIDGLRFLAILPVVLQHLCERALRIAEGRHVATAYDYALMNFFSDGRLGVELFFVISGLIISYPFISTDFRGQPPPSMRNFYLRRLTRLEPPYFLVMIGCYLFLKFTGYTPEGANSFDRTAVSLGTSLAASLVYMHGLLLGEAPKLNPPAWSLEVEIQFYLLAPIAVVVVLRLRNLAVIVLALLTLMAGSIFASHLLIYLWPEHHLIKYFHLFLTGILVNILVLGGLVPRRVPRAVWDIGFIVAIVVLYVLGTNHASMLSDASQVACYLALFLAAFEGMFFKRFLSLQWIFTIGGMCYTIYLIHLPILHVLTGIVMRTSGFSGFVPGVLINTVVSLPILLAFSVAFFLLVEKPCMDPNWPFRVGNWIASRVIVH